MEEPERDEARERLVRGASWCSGPGSTPLPERATLMPLAWVSVSARLPVNWRGRQATGVPWERGRLDHGCRGVSEGGAVGGGGRVSLEPFRP